MGVFPFAGQMTGKRKRARDKVQLISAVKNWTSVTKLDVKGVFVAIH